MAGEWLSNLTLVTNFLCMAISLWFAIYLLARSFANPLTFRAIVALLALAFYYNSAFADIVNPESETAALRSSATIIALVAAHDLTHYLMPLPQRKKFYWVARGMVLLGLVAVVMLFMVPPTDFCDPLLTCPARLVYPWIVIDICKIVVFLGILYNLWLIRKSETRTQIVAIYEAFLLGTSTLVYSLVSTTLNLNLPRFVPNLLMLAALLLLLYSVAREKTFITRRTSPFDLPITLLTITIIVAIYILSAWQIGLTAMGTLILAVLAIFTHSAYDLVRESLNRLFRRQEHRTRQELRHLAWDTSSEKALQRFLQRGLAILCHNLNASNGLIALRQGEQYRVATSLHSMKVGTQFSAKDITLDGVSRSSGVLADHALWLVPAYAGPEPLAVIGIGARKDNIPFSEEDLLWLEDIAEEIGWMINNHMKVQPSHPLPETTAEKLQTEETVALLSKLAYKPDPELVRCVEEGFRNLNDYSRLGKSPLVSILGIQGGDHIECGKAVQDALISILDKYRPRGETPSEPLPREWYAYTILHDAYVEEKLAREIMAKLYISEGTYYRLRRHALRGITRVLLETGAIV